MSVALVTGASGFLGRHAVSALLDMGFAVHALARRPLTELPATWHKVDLLADVDWAELMDSVRPTHLLHLAWDTRHGYFWNAPENLDWVAMTMKLLRAFQSSGGVRVVAAGSCAEYDWDPAVLDSGPCREYRTPLRPATLYGISKLATSRLVEGLAARTSLSWAWARVFLLYGPEESPHRLVPQLIRQLLARQKVQLGSGERLRNFMDARDGGLALARLLGSDVTGPVNVASGRAVSIAELVSTLAALLGAAPGLVDFGAAGPAAQDPRRLVADISRLENEVGYRPRIGLKEGLENAIAWWRSGGYPVAMDD